MICEEPGCTGKHARHGARPPYSELCPAAKRRENARVNSTKYRDRWDKYNGSIKGEMTRIRHNIRQKEARSGATD